MRNQYLTTVIIMLTLAAMLTGQTFKETGKLEWIVKDREYSRSFLESYIDTLMYMDDEAELEVQETDELRVIVRINSEGKPELENLVARGRSGVLNRLDKDILAAMDSAQVRGIVERKYLWDYLAETDVGGGRGDIINVFEEVSNKQVRDAFWWTHRRVDISVFPRIVLRVNPNFAFAAEFGRPELGFPAAASKTINMGMVTEILKFYVTLPTGGYLNLTGSDAHPLEGTYGGILKFDSPNFGGSLSFQDIGFRSGTDIDADVRENVVYNPYSGQFYYSFTSRIGSLPDDPGFVPLGSLRMQIGFTYMLFDYGYIDGDNFVSEDKTDPLSSVLGLFRVEYASNMNDRYFNRIKLATQLNIGLNGFGNVDFNTTYTLMEWLGLNLNITYFWTPIEFNNNDRWADIDDDGVNDYHTPVLPDYPDGRFLGVDSPTYEWSPGVFITPSITVYF